MSTNGKDTIYIDVDEDITGIIDKLRDSSEKIVALVLPKRAAVLQSIVNMKLLKRSADEMKKKVVLITSEANLLPLAGAVGLYVAKTLQSAPAVPDPPKTPGDLVETVSDEAEPTEDVPLDTSAPVGKLAGLPDEEETIEVDDEPEATAAAAGKTAKNKKLKVPNFDSFRKRLFLIVGGFLALFVLWFVVSKVLPKANITITTDSSSIDTKLDFSADVDQQTVDEAQRILPATQKTFTKTDTEKVNTSGQKDNGKKATGTVTMTTQTDCVTQVSDIPANTGVTANSLTFITQQPASFNPSGFQNGKCQFTSNQVNVVAQAAGSKYNLAARDYAVNQHGSVTAHGSDMTGGSSDIVKIVAQSDIDGAKQKILDRNNDTAKATLTKQLKDDQQFAIVDTFAAGTPALTSSSKVDEQASEVTVTLTVSYTMLGVKNDDLKKLLENDIKKHIDPNKQTILDVGLADAKVTVTKKISDTKVKASLETGAEAGAQLDAEAIKKEIAGKKRGDTQAIIDGRPGIQDVKIKYSPFWVGATPSKLSHITITFLQPNGQPSSQ